MSVRSLALLLSLSLASSAAFAAAGTAKGSLTVNGKTVKLTHAYATTKKNPFDAKKTDYYVVITDREVPEAAIHDEFEMLRAAKGLNGLSIQVTNPEKSVISGMIYSPHFETMSQISATGVHELETTAFGPDRVAGKLWADGTQEFFRHTYTFNVTFDAPVMAKPKPAALKGTPLAAGGGEPGKAYDVYRKAMIAGDMARLKKTVAAERAKQLDDPKFKEMLPLIQGMQPKKVKITGGSVDGDTATLLVENLDEKSSKGTITMVKEGGTWKLMKESWKSGT